MTFASTALLALAFFVATALAAQIVELVAAVVSPLAQGAE